MPLSSGASFILDERAPLAATSLSDGIQRTEQR